MYILGLSAYYHDSAAVLLHDGEIVAAAQEERFTRRKHDPRFPHHAVDYCFEAASLAPHQVDHVVFYDKPFLKFERLLETYLAMAPRGFDSFRTAIPAWLKQKLFLKHLLKEELGRHDSTDEWEGKLLFNEHHLSHAASAFYPSPFDEAAVLTVDAVGEWATTSFAIGRGSDLEIQREIQFPHSLGLLYSAFTYYTGFVVNSGEYKVMGLAPYGDPKYADLIYKHLLDVKTDGSFRLNMEYFDYCTGLRMTNERFDRLFGGSPRRPNEPLRQRHMDLAASVQKVTEDIMIKMTRSLAKESGMKNLCLAGGVALNCVANGKIARDGRFEKIWIQPAAGDAGGALGAALCAHHGFLRRPRSSVANGLDRMKGGYLGPESSQEQTESTLQNLGAKYSTLPDSELFKVCASHLADGKALGWVQGRMEFGPRSLGARSILADPRSPTMQKMLNLKVKFRESFRPFAPSVLAEEAGAWFELKDISPYMLLVADVSPERLLPNLSHQHKLFGIDRLNVPRSTIPAVTHVDNSARIQTVHRATNARFHKLLSEFQILTGCPVLVNTSFNVRGEPIVCTPEDAFRCFMRSEIEILVIENCVLMKSDQALVDSKQYEQEFEPD